MARYLPFVLILLAFSAIFGAIWDIWSHVMGFVETFWTPSHAVIYFSIASTGLLVMFVVIQQSIKIGSFSPKRIPNVRGYALSGTGSLVQLLAGVSDEMYHNLVGFDITMWSPPHVAVVFGSVLALLGVYEMLAGETKRLYRWLGTLLSLALAIITMQLALIEYSITESFSITGRWQPYAGYLSILLSPVLVYCFLLGSKRLQIPAGTLVAGTAFLLQMVIYLWWNTTPAGYRFPLVLVISGLLFDIVYTASKRLVWRDYGAAIGAVLGMVITQEIQNPLVIRWDSVSYAVLASVALCLLFTNFAIRKTSLKGYHAAGIALIWMMIPAFAQAHGEDEAANLAPDLHPLVVLGEFLIIFFVGYAIANLLANINLEKPSELELKG
ncbi:hypothetical protein [Paenibacillus beijingensis]|uniref:Uncharacterized protein n=1 Tax=Paenibacillus beijingensis TaxID=1126833 RepID=A0A0D5NQA4_9BACL|nr:hypothetical protein [Paenibacillus beijingensis]AJY77355.1 hypothetical protein VN24_25830 [Paenibacillus beijingensis]